MNTYGVSLAPAAQTDGARAGTSATYHVTVTNLGFNTDQYQLASSGGTYAVTLFDSTCATPQTTTPTVAPGGTADVCVKVAVPGGASDGDTSASTVTDSSGSRYRLPPHSPQREPFLPGTGRRTR